MGGNSCFTDISILTIVDITNDSQCIFSVSGSQMAGVLVFYLCSHEIDVGFRSE
jgi:hypothetical protein